MKRKALPYIPLVLAAILALTHASHAQLVAGPGVTDATSSQPLSNRTFSFSGSIPGQLDGALSVTFSIYPDQQSATALWTETQVVEVIGEKYSVMLGSTSATGLPPDIFSADQAHWLGVRVNGAEKRFLLISVPYAMKAVEAERLGGLLPSDYVTAQQLQSALQNTATIGTPTPTKTTATGPIGQAAAAGTPPQPATDFTDNNTSEVLLVTQQGTGYAIHAISTGDAALFAENSNTTGTALKVLESAGTGLTIGVLAQTSSPDGIPAIFDNTSGQGAILRLQSNGNIVTTFSHMGDINTLGQILAGRFNGDGSGLMNIPPAAINATPGPFPNSVVLRDAQGGFSAGQILGQFSGDGSGLINIPLSAINATPGNFPNSVVARDATGSFGANQIFGGMFFGDGSGLFNVPTSALNASTTPIPNSLVLRDGSGGLSATSIFLNNLSANAFNGTAIQGSAAGNAVGIQASTQDGIGLWAGTTGTDFRSTSLLLTNSASGKLISGGPGSSTNINETFSVSANGDIGFEGAMTTPYDISGTWIPSSLVKLTSIPGNSGAGTVALTSPGDTSGAIGVAFGAGTFSRVQVVQSGQAFCGFDGPATVGDMSASAKPWPETAPILVRAFPPMDNRS